MVEKTRIALVTGANKGIGLEIARQLAAAEVAVIIGVRDAARGQAAVAALAGQGLAARFLPLDVTDGASVAAAAADIAATAGRLDILVNNAGIVDAADGPPSVAAPAAVRRIFETNFFGALQVTQAMLPLLRRADRTTAPARIVNLSSSLGSLTVNGDPTSPYYSARLIGYNASKAALNMLTVQLSQELKHDGIVVTSVSPGYVRTDLTGGSGFMTPAEGAKLPVAHALGEAGVSGSFVEPDGVTPW